MKKTLLTWLLILTSLTTFSADKPISGLTVFNGVPGTNDLIPFVNRADVTQSTNGSTRSMTWSNLTWSLSTSYPAMTLTNIGLTGSNVNVTNIIGYNGSTFYGSGAVVDNWVFYGNNTFTGDTNRFASTVLLTNMNNTVSGNGANITNISPANIVSNGTYLANGTLATNSGQISGGFLTETGTQRKYSLNAGSLTNIAFAPNQIMFRSLFVTNTTVDSVYATNAATAGYPTNAGEVIYATTVANITVPALLSTSSVVYINFALSRTNVQTGITDAYVYVGTNTNCIYRVASAYGDGTTLPSVMGGMADRPLFLNSGSFTNQVIVANAITPQTNWTGGFVVDTSQPWNLRFALTCRVSGAPNTNTHVELNLMEKIR